MKNKDKQILASERIKYLEAQSEEIMQWLSPGIMFWTRF